MADSTTGDRLHEAALRQGSVVGGKFVIKRFLAQGGMGRVYVAEQQPMGRKVALKIMRRDLANDERAVRRFFREAVAVSKLQHPNTVTLFDYGESDNGSLYIAMEYLDGLSLKDVLAAEGRLPLDRVARIIAQVALSLAEAHRKGVVHRDLKPDNVFLSKVDGRRDFVKVIDFGIAHLQAIGREGHEGWPESRITQAGFVCGTPEYMSPEQARGDEIDARADLYSLGVIVYELLEGELPYQGTTPLAIVLKHQTAPVPRLPERHPEPLARLVERLMAKEPSERPASADVFIRELRAALPEARVLTGLELGAAGGRRGWTVPAAEAVADVGAEVGAALDTQEIAETLADSVSSDTALERAATTASPVDRPELEHAAGRRPRGRWAVLVLLVGLVGAATLLLMARDEALDEQPVSAAGPQGPVGGDDESPQPPAVAPGQATATGEGTGRAPGELAHVEPAAPAPVPVTLASEPARARLHVDGLYVGLTPLEVELPPELPHEIVLALDGYADYRTSLTVAPDQAGQSLGPFVLEPRPALITITTEPEGVEVIESESGESWGRTELTREVPRATEPLTLRFERSRYESTERVVVPDQPQIVVHVEMRRERRPARADDDEGEGESSSPFGPPVD